MKGNGRRFRTDRTIVPISNEEAIKALDNRIRQIDAKGSWRTIAQQYHSAKEAGHKTTALDLLALAKAYRDSGEAPLDDGFFFVAFALLEIAESPDYHPEKDDPALRAIGDKIRAAEAAHGLAEDEFWMAGEAPDDVEALRAEWDAAFDRRTATVFRSHGEDDMADLFLNDRLTFDRRYDRGRQSFFGPPDADMADFLRKNGIID